MFHIIVSVIIAVSPGPEVPKGAFLGAMQYPTEFASNAECQAKLKDFDVEKAAAKEVFLGQLKPEFRDEKKFTWNFTCTDKSVQDVLKEGNEQNEKAFEKQKNSI